MVYFVQIGGKGYDEMLFQIEIIWRKGGEVYFIVKRGEEDRRAFFPEMHFKRPIFQFLHCSYGGRCVLPETIMLLRSVSCRPGGGLNPRGFV
jgi:hypothetical protein